MTKKEIIELYLADLNNLVPDSDAKRSRIIDLEDELEALSQHDVSNRRELLIAFMESLTTEDLTQIEIAEFENVADKFLGN